LSHSINGPIFDLKYVQDSFLIKKYQSTLFLLKLEIFLVSVFNSKLFKTDLVIS